MGIRKQLLVVTLVMGSLLLIGSVGFSMIEHISLFEGLYLTVISVLTVGYGDYYPETTLGRLFAIIIIPVGVGVATYVVGTVTSIILQGQLTKQVGRRKMDKRIASLRQHIIVCGFGRVGEQVAAQLRERNVPFVVIERNVERMEHFPHYLYLEGDSTEDELLQKAGIEKASGLVATLPEDADNVFIALTAKGFNPALQIVARAERAGTEEKLRRAGADKVISPSTIGGKRMAMSILKPISVDYVDTVLHGVNDEYVVEEIRILPSSALVGKTLADSNIRQLYDISIVAIKRHERIIGNPSAQEVIEANDVVVVFGLRVQMSQFEQLAK